MLVLKRKEREEIWLGDNICIKVLSVCGNRVSIGIAAPREVSIVRGELRDKYYAGAIIKSEGEVE